MIIGFIGCGNMGSAIIEGVKKSDITANFVVCDYNINKAEEIAKRLGIEAQATNSAVAKKADILFLCVKPNVLFDVIAEIKDLISRDTMIVSIAAGKSISDIEAAFEKPVKVVRVMPNTPALVGEGMSALCPNALAKDDVYMKTVCDIFASVGRAEVVSESVIDAVTAVSGSSPAYVFMMIEAMADAAVMGGMSRDMAYTFAAQAVLGSAKMVLETGENPSVLKDKVCSPSGTTIEAVAVLENMSFRSAIIEAMRACIEKSKSM